MSPRINVIDPFAGPGGLGEGFSSFADGRGRHPFHVVVSAEMDRAAHATLSLRALTPHALWERVPRHEATPATALAAARLRSKRKYHGGMSARSSAG
jgi:site-specific DNA-cytosine methylase